MSSAITMTMIFRASALNRDEKAGGNIQTIKKLSRQKDGKRVESYGFISKVAMRHYLFETLNKSYKEAWREASVLTGDVIQFDMTKENILSCAELDAFGYMYTPAALTRKSAVTPTKAVALESWQGDMQFNANHDLVRRAGNNSPSPVNKEEQLSYFKVSFTIDVERLGRDEWRIVDFKDEDNQLLLFFKMGGKNIVLKDVEKDTEDGVEFFAIGDDKITINGNFCEVSKKLMKKTPAKKGKPEQIAFDSGYLFQEKSKNSDDKDTKSKPKAPTSPAFTDFEENEEKYTIQIADTKYDDDRKTLTISTTLLQVIPYQRKEENTFLLPNGEIEIVGDKNKQAVFHLNEEQKQKRLRQILTVLKNGLLYHSSGENDGIVPSFLIVSALKLPMPIFHSFVELGSFESSILENEYIETKKEKNDKGKETDKKLIYLYNPKKLVGEIDEKDFYTKWDDFLNIICPEENQQNG